jgi:hypothetical protein
MERPAVPLGQRPFEQVMESVERGRVLEELDTQVQTVVRAVHLAAERGGKPKARIALTLSFSVEKGAVFIDADVVTKLPKAPKQLTVMYSTPDGSLHREDPAQMRLGLGVPLEAPALDREAPRSAPALSVVPSHTAGLVTGVAR